MSQNESKDGSVSASTPVPLLTQKYPDLEFSLKALAELQENSYSLIPRSEWANYLSRMSKPDTLDRVRFGWFSGAGERLMNALLESIRTPAQAVEAFQKINERIAFYRDNEEGVSIVLLPYCQRLLAGGILELLSNVPNLPKDILSITTRFLLLSRQLSSPNRVPLIDCLLRKTMLIPLLPNSITNGSIRHFTWHECNQRKRTKNMPAEANAVKSWTAQAYIKTDNVSTSLGKKSEIDGTGGIITVTEFKIPSAGNLISFAWEITDSKPAGRIYAYGFDNTLEEAAEEAYKAFYKTVTQLAFEEANTYEVGKEIVLIGTELTSEQFIKGAGKGKSFYFLIQMPQTEDRNGTLFCLNWPTINKTKRSFTITKVSGKKLTLDGGTVIDIDTVHCYVKQPESYVHTEVLCSKCSQLNFPSTVMGRFVQGVGYQCGPCLDHSMELAELSDAQFDV